MLTYNNPTILSLGKFLKDNGSSLKLFVDNCSASNLERLNNISSINPSTMGGYFIWSSTPQGSGYWAVLDTRMYKVIQNGTV